MIDIGNRRQLFVSKDLVVSTHQLTHVLHYPIRRNIAIPADKPWERGAVLYMVVIEDRDYDPAFKFRAWYRADLDLTIRDGPSYTCYAQSKDGIEWEKPPTHKYECQRHKDNNIVFVGDTQDRKSMAVFKDGKADVDDSQKYKAILAKGRLGSTNPIFAPPLSPPTSAGGRGPLAALAAPQHAAAACESGAQPGVARLSALWTCRSRWVSEKNPTSTSLMTT
jgi:hypothetical protein